MLLASGDPGAVQMEPDWPVSGLCAPYINVEREKDRESERKNISDLHQSKLRISASRRPLFLAKSKRQCYSKKKKKSQFPYEMASTACPASF